MCSQVSSPNRNSIFILRGAPQAHEGLLDESQFEKCITEHPHAKVRNNPSPIYNCHGLAFASRRTTIWNIQEVWKIVKEDNYIEIKDIKDVLPGDLILYIDDDGDIEHSGIVVETPAGGHLYSPMVYANGEKDTNSFIRSLIVPILNHTLNTIGL